ncbi:hypothetical protein [Pacificoceanicola onchidii]|uniref:hypothetical protein n=1 Tax=Pacificoceanicola onchidii TaxID=2562685 RepID=UPI0010A60D1A|nr:hypothetical protein [Pacificoceanicola onchidii]
MRIGYASALPLTSVPGRGAAVVKEVSSVRQVAAQPVFSPPIPVTTQVLPAGALQSLPAAAAQAASAYKSAKGAVAAPQGKSSDD